MITSRVLARCAPEYRVLAQLALATAGALGLALLSRIAIPTQPVPFTLQTFGLFLLGGLLGPRLGALAVAEYLLLGLWGAPVFVGGAAGPMAFVGPTAGYLFGFLPAAALYGWGVRTLTGKPYILRVAGMVGVGLLAMAAYFIPGWLWLAGPLHLGLGVAFAAGVLPFLAMDLLKAVTAATMLGVLERR